MNDFLEAMRDASRARVERARATRPLDAVVAEARAAARPRPLKLSPEGFDVIAEVKRSSPSLGELSRETGLELVQRATAYAEAGAVAVSVLTEPDRFGGDLAHLRDISAALQPLGVPAMRKDFIVDEFQVWEAAAAGAGGVMLIMRILDDATIMAMLDVAAQTRQFVLLEAFDEDDLRRAQPFVGAHDRVLVGLNCRDLATLDVDFDRFVSLAEKFPNDCLRVAESGINNPGQARHVAQAGYSLALVGTALMRDPDPQQLVGDMLTAGREMTQW